MSGLKELMVPPTEIEMAELLQAATAPDRSLNETGKLILRRTLFDYGIRVAVAHELRRFKDYVHKRLDIAGVTVDPESVHKADGCRIGGRLDELIGERDKLRAEVSTQNAHMEVDNIKLRAILAEASRVINTYAIGGALPSDEMARMQALVSAALVK